MLNFNSSKKTNSLSLTRISSGNCENSAIPLKEPFLKDSEGGMALLIVVFVVALCSIIVVNLSQSSFRESRINNAALKRVQAEYLLKSAINFARVLLSKDASLDVDSPKDIWATFLKGQAIPVPEVLGINEPGLNIEMEIQAEDQKFPIRGLIAGGTVNKKLRDALVRLFKSPTLDFDNDTEEVDHTKLFSGRHLKSEELVSLLIDYMDADSDSYSDPDGDFIEGLEGELPENTFANTGVKRIGELATIPGFTPARLRKLDPLITVFASNQINVNLAPPVILRAILDIDDDVVAQILQKRESDEPIKNINLDLFDDQILSSSDYSVYGSLLRTSSQWFQILAKVDYSTSTYFMRAYVSRNQGDDGSKLPVIRSVELF